MPSSEAQPSLSPAAVLRWTRLGALSALALLLGYLESFVPIPIPGVKLGLANIPLLVALAEGDPSGAFFIGLIKVGASALLFGNPISLAYSAAGTLLAFLLMAPLARLKTMRLEMVSIVGALAHEAGQLIVAQQLLGTPLVWYGAPLLAIAGCATGLLCGIAARHVAERLEGQDAPSPRAAAPGQAPTPTAPTPREVASLIAFFALVALFMRQQSPLVLTCCLVLAIGLCLLGKVRPHALLRALAPTLPLAAITLVAQIACNQQGEVLLALGLIALTREALASTGLMLARLVGITCAGVALVALTGRDGLARIGHALLAPLRRLGVPTAGPELAAGCALQLLPVLSTRLESSSRAVGSPLTRDFWTQEIPDLAAGLMQAASQDSPS